MYGSTAEEQAAGPQPRGRQAAADRRREAPAAGATRRGTRPGSPAGGRAWACWPRCSSASTTPSATGCEAEYPHWDDEELFQRARLVIAALLAKIHTVEWTPAVISHPTTVFALRANWFGSRGADRAHASAGSATARSSAASPGAATEHYGVPFSLTEEFTGVYRMHPLLPDDFDLRSLDGDAPLAQLDLPGAGRPALEGGRRAGFRLEDLFYSFGTTHPGAIVLRNFPHFLQEFDPARRQGDRPRRDRHPADPRARRAPLLRVPAAAAPGGADDVRRAHRRRRAGRRDGAASTTATSRRST